jgi:peptidoglycan/xylan/chitin deacetylase (PgdA/CDA1 family)
MKRSVKRPIPILMYHQVDSPPPSGTPMRGLVVSPPSFARQMAILRGLGFGGVSMRDLEPWLRGERDDRVVAITFDDGYLNNLQHALPVLVKNGFTATCYAVSNAFGGWNQWDAQKGVPRKALMDQSEFKQWIDAGMDVGAHTRNHRDLMLLDGASAMDEIAGSKHELEAALGSPVRHFCYPYGHFNDAHRLMVEQAGFLSATTVRRGRVLPGDDPFALPRVLVAQATHWAHFIAKLTTAYEDRHR